jgi:hypothetical protein
LQSGCLQGLAQVFDLPAGAQKKARHSINREQRALNGFLEQQLKN